MPKQSVRVLIADDSGFMQLLLKNILSVDKSIQVIATAENGQQALERTIEHNPDVVLMDMLMPKYDGLYGVELIMEQCPTPIVILSSLGHTNIGPVLSALNLGAFDYLNKPEGNIAKLRTIDSEIIKKIHLAAKADTKKLELTSIDVNHAEHTFNGHRSYDIVVIGSSTGGPNAIERVVKKFPRNLDVPVIIAQHMPANFVESFAKRLDLLVPQTVRVARKGMKVEGGFIYVTPGDWNVSLRINDVTGHAVFVEDRKKYKEYNNPSINAIMLGAAKIYGRKTLSVILTGMGNDGTEGIKAVRAKGGYTIAQDRESSVVFGMPKSAIASGCIERVVPIDEMGEFITNCLE